MTLLIRTPHTYEAERRYVLDVVLSAWLGLEYELAFGDTRHVSISVIGDPRQRELRLADVLFATPPGDWLGESTVPQGPLPRMTGAGGGSPAPGVWTDDRALDAPAYGALPILFGEPGAGERAWVTTGTGLGSGVDVLGSVFFLLTRYEEAARPARDEHGRFPPAASLAASDGFLDRPVADDYVDFLWGGLRALWPGLSRRMPAFRLRLTHDIDRPWASLGQSVGTVAHALVGDLLRRRDPRLAAGRARSLLRAQSGRVDGDPFNTFDLLMDVSERHDIRSTFYVMAASTEPAYDGWYRLSDAPIADLLGRIHARGHEVGLHASYGSHLSDRQMQAEVAELRAACRERGFEQPEWGVRQHYLRFANPVTWRVQEAAGLDHDSTIGFADRNGFRAGTCREYPVFDLLERRTLRLHERPLIFMDAASPEYLGGDLEGATARARGLVDECRARGGDAVLLFHNSSLAGARHRAHYGALVDMLAGPASAAHAAPASPLGEGTPAEPRNQPA